MQEVREGENKNTPGIRRGVLDAKKLFVALNSQETVTWVFVNRVTCWQVATLRAFVLAEVVDSLLFATTQGNLLGVQVVGNTF